MSKTLKTYSLITAIHVAVVLLFSDCSRPAAAGYITYSVTEPGVARPLQTLVVLP